MTSHACFILEFNTPLHVAAEGGFLEVAELLIDYGDADVDRKNIKGFTPLCEACDGEHYRMIRLLLECGADPDPLIPLFVDDYQPHIVKILKDYCSPSISQSVCEWLGQFEENSFSDESFC